jgi:hypothetical protein
MSGSDNPDRRRVLAGALGSLGWAATCRLSALAQAAPAPHRIDIHHHFAPPAWVVEVKGRPLLQAANTAWTPEKSIDDMDKGGVTAAMVSITNPGLWFGDHAVTNKLARACNEYGASLVQLVTTAQVLFGTDFPPGGTSADVARALATLRMFSETDRRAIDRDNAVRLLPRLGRSLL